MVHSDLPVAQSQREDLVRQEKKPPRCGFRNACLLLYFSADLFLFSEFISQTLFFVLCGSILRGVVPFSGAKRLKFLPAFRINIPFTSLFRNAQIEVHDDVQAWGIGERTSKCSHP